MTEKIDYWRADLGYIIIHVIVYWVRVELQTKYQPRVRIYGFEICDTLHPNGINSKLVYDVWQLLFVPIILFVNMHFIGILWFCCC